MTNPFEIYLKKVEADFRRGIATEHTYRSALENLIESLALGVDASNDPKHIECGAPDFIVERGRVPLGYVETKDIGVDLNHIEKSEQLKRYLPALNNLILTDYLEFRWYVNGVLRLKTRIADIGTRKLTPNPKGIELTEQMFTQFFQTETPTVTSAKELATRMAEQTHLVRDLLIKALNSEDHSSHAALARQYKAFCDFLLPALKPEEFADLYAQTMAYGLFAAKLSAPENAVFNRAAAYRYLVANKFLRRLFLDVGEELDGTLIAPFLDDIASLLEHADFASILSDFGQRTRKEDPVVHFYETFLAAYDPKMRKSRGVYYTPEPVVQFIVNSVDWLLKNRFERSWGLADPSVKILDPATGTGTFLYYVIQSIHDEITQRGQEGTWAEKSKELLKRVFGFELLMAPYVISHLKLGLLMQEMGAPLTQNDRLKVYLTNTLEEGITRSETFDSLGYYIAEEASQAAQVKKQEDIMVVLGNPPYSGHSANSSVDAEGKPNFIGKLIREYYFVDGAPLGERNPKWLQDDYVKFIRYGEWRIEKTGHGILAFITNHGYLDNPTFRGMRQHLMKTFDEIYVLDLHGNSKKKEQAPDGSKDENVFDIQQGVSILLAIKNQSSKHLTEEQTNHAVVRHFSYWGLRNIKYTRLKNTNLDELNWKNINPDKPFYLFVPQDVKIRDEYLYGWKFTDVMPMNVTGIFTARDNLTIHWSTENVNNTIKDFISLSIESARSKYKLGKDVRDWKVELAQNDVRETGIKNSKIIPIYYRPFDIRYSYYTGKSRGFICMPRAENMKHLISGENMAIGIGRQGAAVSQNEWDLITCFSEIPDLNGFRRGGVQAFPLYLYTTPEETAGTLFAQSEMTRRPNLAPKFFEEFSIKLGLQFIQDGKGNLNTTFGPEDIFNYAYAVFHSPTYRERYAEFLKIDFPRLPLTSDKKLFGKLVAKGEELVGLHLLKSKKVDNFITSFPVTGSNTVEKVGYASGKVWINTSQYFGGVPEKVWNFKIGGYQVCDKWLKDRKGRTLMGEDISHYQRVVVALQETMRIMDAIDGIIGEWPIK